MTCHMHAGSGFVYFLTSGGDLTTAYLATVAELERRP